jgi:hypothetical protein
MPTESWAKASGLRVFLDYSAIAEKPRWSGRRTNSARVSCPVRFAGS